MYYKNKINKFLLSLVIFSSVIYFLPYNKIEANTGLTIQPIKISKTINPEETVSGFIRLTNASSEDVNVELGIEDFVPTAGTSNISFVGRAEGNTTVKDWIEVDMPKNFVFKKDETKELSYRIKAPKNAEPGGHFGVLFFKATPVKDTGQLKVGTRVGILLFVTVPGNSLQKGKIVDFKAPKFIERSPVNFTVNFENTGTVHFEPKGLITIKNIFNREVAKIDVSGQTVLPTGIRDINATWQTDNLLIGRYSASIALFDGEGNQLTARDLSFYAFPIKYSLIFIGSIILLFSILKFIKKKVNISITVSK